MQDPQPKSIIDGLKEFYSHYDSGNMPTDEQLNQLATNFAGREAELWSQLYGHYEKAPVGEDVINSLVTGFANPFAEKKKGSGGDASSLPGGSNPPLIDQANPPEDQEPVQDTPKTDMLSGAVANAAATGSGVENTKGVGVGAASAVSTAIRGTQQGVENPEEFESPEAIDFNNLYDTSREERQAEELAIEVSTVVGTIDPFLLAENPTSAIQLLNDGLRSEYRPFLDYLAETPDPVAEGEFYMRGLNQIAGTDRKTVREFEATVGDQMVEAFEELKETLGPQRARVRELQAVIESAQDPAMVQQAQTELQSILSDEGYQQGEQLYQSYIDDFGFGPYQESIERMYAAQLAQGKLQEQYPEFFQEMEARESQQKVIDQMAAAGMRPNPRVPGTFRPEILRFGDFSFYQQIEAPFVRTMTESIKSIAATPGIVMSAFGAEQVGYGWAKSVDRMINVDEMVPVSSNVQRGLRETVGRITVDGNDYQVVVEDGEPIGVRDKDGYLVYGSQKEKILTEWNNSGGEATKKFNWGQVLPIVSSGTAQMVGTILLSRGISSRANLSSRFQQQMVGAGTMTAQIINQQYQMAIDELGPENADLAARYALASSLLISSVNLATNPIEAGITTSIGRQSVKTMQRNLAKGPMGAYRAGMLQQASLLAQNVARYSKGVVTEGIEGLSEQGVDQAVRMMTQTSSSPNRRMDVDLSLDGFYNSFLEEALGTMFTQMAFTPRANFHQEALYQAYQKPEVLDGLDKDAQKHYRNVFTKAQAFFGEAGKISEEGQAEVLSAIDAAERIASAAASAPKTSAEAQNYVKGIVAAAEEGAITDATFQEVEEAPSLVQIEKSRSNALSPLPGEIVQDGTGRSMEVIEADASGITFTDGQVEHTVSTQEWEVMVNSIFDAQVSKHHPGVKQQDQAMLSDINKRFGGPKKSVAAEFDETVSSVGHSTMDWVAAWFSGGGRLTRSSMSEADDPVKVKEDRSTFDRQFFHETKGDPVDMAAMWVAEQAGITEAEAQQAIVDFVNQNRRTGVNQYMRDRVEEVRQAERGTATQRATVQQVIDEYNGDVSAAAAEADKAIAGDASTDPIMLGLTQDELVQLQQMRGVEASGEPLVFTPNEGDAPENVAGITAATGATVMVHTSPQSLPKEMRGKPVRGAYDPVENVVHINAAMELPTTLGHEGAHVLMRNAPPDAVKKLYNALVGLKGGKAVIKFAKKYGDPTKPEVQEEAVAEYLGRVLAGDIKVEKTFWQKIVDFFAAAGYTFRNVGELMSLANAYVEAVKTKTPVPIPATFTASADGKMKYQVDAYHGSPHEFDQFSTKYIGTGEGAQAFGWGLYFTDRKDIAEYYRTALSKWGVVGEENIAVSEISTDPMVVLSQFMSDEFENIRGGISVSFNELTGDKLVDRFSEWIDQNFDEERVSGWLVSPGSNPIQEYAEKFKGVTIKPVGYVYDVSIHDGRSPDEYKWLDWNETFPFDDFSKVIKALPDVSNEKAGLILADLLNYSLNDISGLHDEVSYLLLTESVPGYENTGDLGNLSKAVESDLRDAGLLDGKLSGEIHDAVKNYVVGAVLGTDVSALSDATSKVVRSLRDKSDIRKVFSKDNYKGVNGSVVYQGLEKILGSDKAASLFLLDQGIDGVRYPAQSGGRGDYSKGSNYVVFDENAVTVKSRMKFQLADAEKLPDHDQRVIQAKGIAADYAKTANTTILTAAIADTTGISMAQAADIVKAYKEAGSTKFPGARQISRAFWKVMHLVGIDKTKENNFLQGWLLASRGLDANILKYNELRLGTVARYTERGIKRAQKADQLLRASDIPNVRDLFDQYMRGDTSVASQLGDELTAAAQGLRASLDNIIQALIIEGHVSGVNAEVLAENLGKHLTRAFRIHYDDKYKPTDDIKQAWINKEAQRLYKKYVKQGVDPAKAQADAIKLATNRAERLLAKHKEKPMRSGSSASKDVGIFKRRKQLPKELEELIAEAQASGKLDATERQRARELIVGQEIEYAKKTIPARIVGKKATREAIQRMLDEGVSMPGFENMPVRAKEWVKLRLDEANDLADRAIESILTGDVGAVLNYLDKETRDLLGEYSDPIEAYLFTMQRTVTHLATARYLQSVAALGQGRFVWNEDDPEAPERAIPFASEGSRTLSPLNGKVVLPEYVDYIKQVDSDAWINDYEGNPIAWTYRTMLKTMQVVNYMKTILSPATQSKNVLGGVVMSAANGNLPLIGLNEFVKDKRNVSQWISTMKNYGLLGDNISYRALKEGLLDKDPEKALAQRIGDNVWKRAGRFAKEPWRVKGLEWTYAFGDDMFKAASFIQEASQLSWALFDTKYSKLSADQRQIIDEMAAERVKNTYPNYSRIGEAGKYLSKNVFMGQFIAFQAEAIRTQANILMYAMNDILSPNNKVKALGFKRLLGFTAVFSARYFVVSNLVQIAGVGATGLMGMLFGDDEDRELEKDYRLFVLDHQTNHELIPLKADDGSIRYIDLGSADPYGTTVAAIKAATMTDNPNEAAIALVKEMLLPFFGRTIIADLQNSLANNKDVYGNRIYTNANTFNEKVENMFWYAVRVAGPGAYNSYVKVAGADEDKRFAELIGQLTGIKVYNRTLIGDYSPLKAILRESVGGYGTESVVTDTKYFAKKIYAEQGYEAALDEFKKRALPGMDRAREAYLAARKLMSDDAFLAVDEMVEDVVGASKQSSPAYFIRHYIQTGEWVDPNESFFQ